MPEKDREVRIHVRAPENLKARYVAWCAEQGVTMSDDMRKHMEVVTARAWWATRNMEANKP